MSFEKYADRWFAEVKRSDKLSFDVKNRWQRRSEATVSVADGRSRCINLLVKESCRRDDASLVRVDSRSERALSRDGFLGTEVVSVVIGTDGLKR